MTLEARPARPEDREAILAISAQIWEGQDYLPEVWEEWLHDPAGPLLVAILDGRPVAVNKIVLQSPAEAWLAGMRVDPAYRGRGIATFLTEHCLRWLDMRHIPIARFTTDSENTPIHRLATRLGFRRIVVVQHLRQPMERATPRQLPRVLAPDEEEEAWRIFSTSPFVRTTQGLYGIGWTWRRFTRFLLHEHIARGEVLAWGKGLATLAIVTYRSPQTPRRISMMVAGDREAGLEMVRSLLCDPHLEATDPENPPHLRLTVPEGVEDMEWIASRLSRSEPPWGMWLFQRDAREVGN